MSSWRRTIYDKNAHILVKKCCLLQILYYYAILPYLCFEYRVFTSAQKSARHYRKKIHTILLYLWGFKGRCECYKKYYIRVLKQGGLRSESTGYPGWFFNNPILSNIPAKKIDDYNRQKNAEDDESCDNHCYHVTVCKERYTRVASISTVRTLQRFILKNLQKYEFHLFDIIPYKNHPMALKTSIEMMKIVLK